MKKSRLLALLLVLLLLFGMAACASKETGQQQTVGTTSESSAGATQTETEEAPKTPVTLRVLIGDDQVDWNDYPDNPIAAEIKRLTGITIEFVTADSEKFKVMIAGGDLPDIVRARNSGADMMFKPLIEANNVIPLDDLLQTNGKDILNTIPKTIDFSRKFWSNGQNKVYYLPINIGLETPGIEPGIGPVMRWDYYKELGCPEIRNMDDILVVLDQMVKKHPTTPDGKKVYGVSMWNDWGTWCYQMVSSTLDGYGNGTKLGTNNAPYARGYTDLEGPNWRTVEFYYKANKMGLLHPDALTMTYGDFEAAATNGQILFGIANWPFMKFNGENNKDGKGYMAIPFDWGCQWYGADWPAGWYDKGFCISKNCKTPDRAMDLFNLLWSYDGARLVYSGVKGVHWDIVDGKPVLFEETIKMKSEGGAEWNASQITKLNIFVGLNQYTIHPDDNLPVSLFDTEDMYEKLLNPLQKDFCSHYGVKYPSQAFTERVKAGKCLNQSSSDTRINAVMPPAPDDLNIIVGKADEIFFKGAAKCILSKSDEEFEANRNAVIDEIKALGIDKYVEWYDKTYNEAKAIVEAK